MAAKVKYLGELKQAAEAIRKAKALVVTAGAGMGVDSGLPDFRSAQGFWKAYPPIQQLGLHFSAVSNPKWFRKDPAFAWGFFGHRYNMYQNTTPHQGYTILKELGEKMDFGYFVYTSNVDGQFQKAGFSPDQVMECHGSIHHFQCTNPEVSRDIWPIPENTVFDVDEKTLKLKADRLPSGPPGVDVCLARPNILMFEDNGWVSRRVYGQEKKLESFLLGTTLRERGGSPFVVIEIGAGIDVQTVRKQSESMVLNNKGTLIRINPQDYEVPNGHISLPMSGLEALQTLKSMLQE